MNKINRKYQIFISSTFEDLISERRDAVHIILNTGNIPSGMEFFNASVETSWDKIKKTIEECDYYLLILGHRYGSICKEDGISYTEKEYNYASEIKKPRICFVRDADGIDLLDEIDQFRKKVLKDKLCIIWKDNADLNARIATSIQEAIVSNPEKGWIKVTNEIDQFIASRELEEYMKSTTALRSKNLLESLNSNNYTNGQTDKYFVKEKIEINELSIFDIIVKIPLFSTIDLIDEFNSKYIERKILEPKKTKDKHRIKLNFFHDKYRLKYLLENIFKFYNIIASNSKIYLASCSDCELKKFLIMIISLETMMYTDENIYHEMINSEDQFDIQYLDDDLQNQINSLYNSKIHIIENSLLQIYNILNTFKGILSSYIDFTKKRDVRIISFNGVE